MSKFKQGDKVVVLEDYLPYCHAGDVGIVDQDYSNFPWVDFNNQGNKEVYHDGRWAVVVDILKLYEEEQQSDVPSFPTHAELAERLVALEERVTHLESGHHGEFVDVDQHVHQHVHHTTNSGTTVSVQPSDIHLELGKDLSIRLVEEEESPSWLPQNTKSLQFDELKEFALELGYEFDWFTFLKQSDDGWRIESNSALNGLTPNTMIKLFNTAENFTKWIRSCEKTEWGHKSAVGYWERDEEGNMYPSWNEHLKFPVWNVKQAIAQKVISTFRGCWSVKHKEFIIHSHLVKFTEIGYAERYLPEGEE